MTDAMMPRVALLLPKREWEWSLPSRRLWELRTELPNGSGWLDNIGAPSDIAGARRLLAERFLGDEWNDMTYALWIDADMLPAKGTIRRIVEVAHAGDLDMLAAPTCARLGDKSDGLLLTQILVSGQRASGRETGVVELSSTGLAFTLMHRRVLERVGDPFFEYPPGRVGMGEDGLFCWRARQLGLRIWCDFSLEVGHLTMASAVLRNGAVRLEPALTGYEW